MDKILFIVPPHISYDSFVNPGFNERVVVKKTGNYGSPVTDMPIGVLSLSAYLKKFKAAEVKLIDFNVVLNKLESFEYKSFSELFFKFLSSKECLDFSPGIIGISTLFAPAYHNMLDIAEVARKIFATALIIAGGGVPSNMYKEVFKDSAVFDALCFGEGEKPLLELVKATDKKEFLKNHPSWITRDKAENKRSFQHDFIENLDEIPFLDFNILYVDDYKMNSILSLFPIEKERNRKGMPVMTSRGCPHRCCFCSSHTVHGRKMRYYSMDRVREDLSRLREQYGAETLVFLDDHLMADKQRVYGIFDIMKSLRLTAFFENSLALYALDRKMLEAIKSVGVDNILLSVESGSNRVLREIMHKPLDLTVVKRVVNDCRQLGIAADISILIGLPGEKKQDLEDARSFLKTISGSWFRINMATPLVGSEMLDICLKYNYLKDSYISCDFKRAIVETEDFTAEYIQERAYFLNLELNFVENSDFRLGNYDIALKGFENAIRVKNDHAIAYYFAAKCYEKMGNLEKSQEYTKIAKKIVREQEFWSKYVNMFNLPLVEKEYEKH